MTPCLSLCQFKLLNVQHFSTATFLQLSDDDRGPVNGSTLPFSVLWKCCLWEYRSNLWNFSVLYQSYETLWPHFWHIFVECLCVWDSYAGWPLILFPLGFLCFLNVSFSEDGDRLMVGFKFFELLQFPLVCIGHNIEWQRLMLRGQRVAHIWTDIGWL